MYERCIKEVEDFKHLLWSCRFSVGIWKETEKQINERFRKNIEIKYHNLIIGLNPEDKKTHEAINTINMAIKKRLCYKDRLMTYDPCTIKSILEGRMNVEKYPILTKGYMSKLITIIQVMLYRQNIKWNVTPLLGDFGGSVGFCGLL